MATRAAKREEVSPHQLYMEKRRREVEDLYLREYSQARIAEELRDKGWDKVSQKTVSRDLERLRDEWKEARLVELSVQKERELAKIDAVERTAWSSFEQSKRVVVTTKAARSARGKESALMTGGTRTVDGPGDHAFLAVVLKCIEERCKILGHYAPKIRQLRLEEARSKLASVLGIEPAGLPS